MLLFFIVEVKKREQTLRSRIRKVRVKKVIFGVLYYGSICESFKSVLKHVPAKGTA
ncbi:hypothetical protein JOC94_000169 [Bacillus thermophilus]|uniref:Uncharacterized protein n=1 Tax=Siminovitchia thermophila TaxID=1245522 RepID=A0ABS2R2S0_9BACI|nr:hypothetical protein [Siminovitchia thermophila]